MNELDTLTIQQIRMLSAEMVQKAKSGHPGLPLGAAPIAYAIFNNLMKFDPTHADWMDRDRFVLSAGHGSAMLYAMLFLYGYDVTMEDLKQFRQLGSRTPGHPEYWCLPGVETATGPLGAGFSNAVGMALAEKHLRARYGHEIVNHRTYVIVSDGDMEEGISSEAASFAGTHKLSNLVAFYDSNGISIEGNIADTFTENVRGRFEAFNWYVDTVNGEDPEAVT
ncbi:transketolase, partial [Myxococcota bacterium]|nr:transketolase [Myxococcota bacterium]